MALRVGLTGGIGSGKSTIARIFKLLGVPVYSADAAARRLMEEDVTLRESVIRLLGKDAYPGGLLDRKYVAGRVFSEPALLSQLNALVHPATLRDAADWMAKQVSPYCIKEAALIFESGAQEDLDYVIGVAAPESLRLERAMKRDQSSAEEIKSRMKEQIPETIKMRLCDFIIHNDEQQLVIKQVLLLHGKLTELSKASAQ